MQPQVPYHEFLFPPWSGTLDQINIHPGYEWLKKLPNKKIYFSLFQAYPSRDLPAGYDYYIVSFHYEIVDIAWLKRQKLTGPIFLLSDVNSYDIKIPGVYFLPFYYWHYQLQQMISLHGIKEKSLPQYKFSAVCNRVSQSKVWVVTKLLKTAKESSMVVLHSKLDERWVNSWEPTGNNTLDQLTQLFRDQYLGKEIRVDNFDNHIHNKFIINSNPWQPLYQNCAVHFTNESFHYSSMMEGDQTYIWPGPFITEKTFKCLLGATGFVSVGQFEIYKTLTNLGLEFNYGFDLSWDLDPGNITRAESIIKLIDQLNQFDVEELTQMTLDSNRFNQNYITSGQFFTQCEKRNNESIEIINSLIS